MTELEYNPYLVKGLPLLCVMCGWRLKFFENPCPNCGSRLNWKSKKRCWDGTNDPKILKERPLAGRFWYVYPMGWAGWNNALRGIYRLEKRKEDVAL